MTSVTREVIRIESVFESPAEADDTFQEVNIVIILLKAGVHERYLKKTMRQVDEADYHKWKVVILGASTMSLTKGEKSVCLSND